MDRAPPTPLTAPDTPRAATPEGTPQRNGYGRPPRPETWWRDVSEIAYQRNSTNPWTWSESHVIYRDLLFWKSFFWGSTFYWPIPHLVPFLPLTKAQSDRRTPSQPRKRRVNEAQKAMKKGRDETNICELSLLRNGLLLEFLTSLDPFEWKDHTRNASENPQDQMGPSICSFPFLIC